MIDWTLPLETVENPPRSAKTGSAGTQDGLARMHPVTIGDECFWYDHYGKVMGCPDLRNVPALRTGDEALRRMESLCRRIAKAYDDTRFAHLSEDQYSWMREAYKIVPMLPIDPDLIEARDITYSVLMRYGASEEMIAAGEIIEGERDDAIVLHVAREAMARGRELERAEYEPYGAVEYSRGKIPTYTRKSEAVGIEPGK